MPNNGGGATGVGRQLLLELARLGVEVDCYFSGEQSAVPDVLTNETNLKFFCLSSSWQWNKWYSRNNFMAFATGQYSNLRNEIKLAETIVREHRKKPYDLVFQFSHIEMHALKRFKRQLPPIVLYPTVHHAAELRWHRKEAHLSKRSESLPTRMMVRLMLLARATVQKRHAKEADYIISLSRNFASELCEDYRLHPDKVAYIVPNPIDVEAFVPGPGIAKYKSDGVITFLYVSRISVRKGTEMMVELSHRLKDLAGKVRLMIVGNHSLWSDYRGLLNDLNGDVATYVSEISGKEMLGLYNSVDALIIPSHYEPFGLVVGEALACGLPVIASDKIGAAEQVNRTACRIFPAGQMDALEQRVRELLGELQSSRREEISDMARQEARRLFSSATIGSDLATSLHRIVRGKAANG